MTVCVALTAVAPWVAGRPADASPATAGAPLVRQAQEVSNMRVVGYSDLGGGGRNGDVAVVGSTAVVAAGLLPSTAFHTQFFNPLTPPVCPNVSVKVVDLSEPSAPAVVATIPLPSGVVAADVDALRVATPAFTGDLAAVALHTCSAPGGNADKGVAYYDVTDPATPSLLGRYLAGFDEVPPEAPACSPASATRCAVSQHLVSLVQRPDGRVLSLSTNPTASTTAQTGDLKIVDVTDPRAPTQVAGFPPLGARPAGFSSPNGCRNFQAGHGVAPTRDGRGALFTYLDGGVYNVDLTNPALPVNLGRFQYPGTRSVEGGAAYVAAAEAGRPLALVTEDDWIAPTSGLRIDAPASIAGTKLACEAMFTLFDRDGDAQLYRRPGGRVSGDLVIVGRGCPARQTAAGAPVAADPYLGNPAGKIALVDRNPTPSLQPGLSTVICSFADRVKRAQDAGATAVVFADTNPVPTFSPDGVDTGLSIPALMIEKADADALRSTLCPSVVGGTCSGGQPVSGSVADTPGEWGGLRILDLTDPAAPTESGVYRTARSQAFPPPDNGVYAAHHAVTRGNVAYVAWNSDGLRVLDLSAPVPRELASFVPADSPDPTGAIPAKTLVTGVAALPGQVVITDVNSGLYVLQFTGAGYQTVAADGGVFAFGDAEFLGSTGDILLNFPIVGMAAAPSRRGYWMVAADGGVFSFGDVGYYGSTGDLKLNSPVVAMAATPSGRGYWLAAADGGVFAFGDAAFYGSTGDLKLNKPVVGMAATPTGRGYRLVGSDGGVFAFGDAAFHGSTGDLKLNSPVVGITASSTGRGYWLVAADGGVFTFGDALFLGSMGGTRLNSPMVGLANGSPL